LNPLVSGCHHPQIFINEEFQEVEYGGYPWQIVAG